MTESDKLALWEAYDRGERIGFCVECREPGDEPLCEFCCRWETLDEESAGVK